MTPTLAGLPFVLLTLYLLPFYAFLALVTAAALGRKRERSRGEPAGTAAPAASHGQVRFAVVVPAHNEDANVAATVAHCLAMDYDPAAFKVFVIADNCTDATAAVARAARAEVIERHDPVRRSKGYALEDVFATLPDRGPFDAVVVVDADTVVAPDLLARFASALAAGTDWAQCYYTVLNPDASWRTRLLTYAFSLFNGVWLLGQDRLGLSVGFRGNGMCFSTRGLARVPWRARGLVEDQEFAWSLRTAGERVRFLPETRVYAEMVSRGGGAVTQRRRWEQGRRSLRNLFTGPILSSPKLGPLEKALALTELYFPPLTKLFGLLLLATFIYPLAFAYPPIVPVARSLLPVHLVMALTLVVYASSPFPVLGLPWRFLLALWALPYYAAWKVLTGLLNRPTREWVRTEREVVRTRKQD